MDPITLDPHPAAGHSSEYTIRVASAIGEAVRVLNYATLSHNAAAGVPYPSTAYDLVSCLHTATAGMDQLFRQVTERLTEIAATQDLRVSHGLFTSDPDAAVSNALESLDTVRSTASALEGALSWALNALSPIGVRISADDAEPESDTGPRDDGTGGAL